MGWNCDNIEGQVSNKVHGKKGDTGCNFCGRWSWTTLRGKGDLSVRIISVYGPHPKGGANSSVSQQRTQLLIKGDTRSPREAFWTDIVLHLGKWKKEGHQLIVAGDWNRCSNSENLSKVFSDLNLIECYRQHHGTPPPTRTNSTRSINSAWCSSSLIIIQTGFSACGDGISKDHRLGWLDVSCKSAFGDKIPKVINSAFISVKYQDPRCRKKYNKIYKKATSQIVALT